MEIVYVYFNLNKNLFYYKSCITYSEYSKIIGSYNSFNHLLVQKLKIVNNCIYDLDKFNFLKLENDLKKERKILRKNNRKLFLKKIINKIINYLIDLLYKFKSRF